MGFEDKIARTIKCDAKGCDKVHTFNPQIEEEVANLPLWIRTTRTVTLGNRKQFTYCSDVCEVNGVTTGDHNVPEPKVVQEATPAQANQAIAAAQVVDQLKAKKTPKK